MHNRLWLSLLLAFFITASGCAKHEDSSSADMSSATSGTVETVQDAASPSPEKQDVQRQPASAKPKDARKKEAGSADEKAIPAGDDMERMD